LGESGSGVVVMANSDNGGLLFERIINSVVAEYGWKPIPNHQDSPVMTADLLSRLKGTDAVLAWYRKAKAEGTVQGLSPRVLNHVGTGLMMAGKTQDGLKVFEANAALYPDVVEVMGGLGEAYVKAGRKPDAIATFKKVLKLDPKSEGALEALKMLGAKP
ncbi:tetratricopeptide repeat protein, partial [Corallococcus sp. CA053C]|uniref:tetratricopeptide repeat protein n=1 Tax=Corallococcus sp. CA053C TaxID=2316732 RepID=UPI000EA3CF23